MDCTATIIESQADWLSATIPNGEAAHSLIVTCERWIEAEHDAGMKRTAFNLHGLSGVRCGRAAFGLDNDRTIIQLSGNHADTYLADVLASGATPTRLDLAVTARLDPPSTTLASEVYTAYESARTRGLQRAAASLFVNDKGGSTCYIGTRGAYRCLRLYNKGAERAAAKDERGYQRYHDTWRWEVELASPLAPRVTLDYAAAVDRGDFARRYLHSLCEQWRIPPPWPSGGPLLLTPGFSRRSDADRQVTWLVNNVLPVIRGLRSRGRGAEVDRILMDRPQGEMVI